MSITKIIKKLSNEDYHARPEIGSSSLKVALKSPLHYKTQIIDGRAKEKKSTAMDIGTCAHSAVLEQSFDGYIKGPEVSSKRVKAWTDFVKENPKKIVLTPQEYSDIRGMFEAFFAHPLTNRILANGQPEWSFFCEDPKTGLYLKARPDWLIEEDDGFFIVDYKTTDSAHADDFERRCYNLRYDISAAHYISVLEQVLKKPCKDFIFIAQEREAPYAIGVYRAFEDMIERAEKRRRRALDQIAHGIKTNEWPGYPASIQDIDLPGFAIHKEELLNEKSDEVA